MSFQLRITMVVQAINQAEAEKFFMFISDQAQGLCDASPEFEWVSSCAAAEPGVPAALVTSDQPSEASK